MQYGRGGRGQGGGGVGFLPKTNKKNPIKSQIVRKIWKMCSELKDKKLAYKVKKNLME